MLDRLNAITRRYEDLGQELLQAGADSILADPAALPGILC